MGLDLITGKAFKCVRKFEFLRKCFRKWAPRWGKEIPYNVQTQNLGNTIISFSTVICI